MPITYSDIYGNTPPTMAATSSAPNQTKQQGSQQATQSTTVPLGNRSIAITWAILVGLAVMLRIGYELL